MQSGSFHFAGVTWVGSPVEPEHDVERTRFCRPVSLEFRAAVGREFVGRPVFGIAAELDDDVDRMRFVV